MSNIALRCLLLVALLCLCACNKHEETRNEMNEICFKAAPQLRTTFNNLEAEIFKWQETQEKFTRLRDAAQTAGGKATAEAKLSKIKSVLADLKAKHHKVLEQIEMIAMESEGIETKLDKIALEDLSRRTGDSVRDAEELREGLAEESGFDNIKVASKPRPKPRPASKSQSTTSRSQQISRGRASKPMAPASQVRQSSTTGDDNAARLNSYESWHENYKYKSSATAPPPRAIAIEEDDDTRRENTFSLYKKPAPRAIPVEDDGRNSLRSKLHHEICNKASAVYVGSYGRQKAIYSIQWLDNDVIRGSIFLYQANRQLLIYGTNYEQGILRCEIWEAGRLSGRTTLYKKRRPGGGIAWAGFLENGGIELYLARNHQSNRKQYRSDYSGRVGSSAIDVSLFWKQDAIATGTYYSRSSGRRYRLEGDNTVDGVLYLDEYTNNNLSARALLRKSRSGGRITWQGIMYNTDGRNVPMYFTKK